METERLILDPVRESDKADYFANISHDKKVLETFICRYAESLEDFDFSAYPGREDLFAIRLKQTGRLIGILTYFDVKDGACEIGYGLGSAYWNRGYATEAVRCFLAFLLQEKGIKTVYASFFPGNDASRRVMEKCGMRFHHVSEKELAYLGTERDLIYYVLDTEKEKEKRTMNTICGADCEGCSFRENCCGCAATCGRPFGGTCVAAEYIKFAGKKAYEQFKAQLLDEINALLGANELPKAAALYELPGSFVNLPFPLPNGETVKFLDDRNIYLGTQIESPVPGVCIGIAADMGHILVSRYGQGGTEPELILYKKR